MSVESSRRAALLKTLKQKTNRLHVKQKHLSKTDHYFSDITETVQALDQLLDEEGAGEHAFTQDEHQILSAAVTDTLYLQRPNRLMGGTGERWLSQYRRIWRQEIHLLLFCAISFVVSACIGWTLAVSYTDLVHVILSQDLVEQILEHQRWFDGIKKNPALIGFQIAYNNITVSINCMLASALLGIGGLYLLMFNGLFFGAVMGFCYLHEFHTPLIEFVISHGPLELSIIVAAAFNGLLFGRSFYMRPFSLFTVRLREGARRATIIVRGVIPWLMIAAAFEVFVSPWDYLSLQQKAAAGALLALSFWCWSFYPPDDLMLPVDASSDKSSKPPSSNSSD